MRWYWGKIALTALLIFGVGFGVIEAVKATKRTVVRAVESADDLTIPLPFIPFNFDGTRLGTFRKIVFHRSTPETVQSVEITVRLADSVKAMPFSNCQLTVDDPSRLNEHSSFRCSTADSTMEGFGSVVVQSKDEDGDWTTLASVPLVLPKEVAARIRGHEARAHAAELGRDRFRAIGDSMQVLGRMLGGATSDSIRSRIQEEMQSLEEEMADLRESISDNGPAPAPSTAPVPPTAKALGSPAKPPVPKATKAPR